MDDIGCNLIGIVFDLAMTIALGPGFNLYVLPEGSLSSVRDLFGLKRDHKPVASTSSISAKDSVKAKESDPDEQFDMEKDESSLQILSSGLLEQTLDFELDSRPAKASGTLSRGDSNSSLQLLPSNISNNGTETGDELDEYEIISDSELLLTEEGCLNRRPKDKIKSQKVNFKDLLESDL